MPNAVKGEEIENFLGITNFADLGGFAQKMEDRMQKKNGDGGRRCRRFKAYLC